MSAATSNPAPSPVATAPARLVFTITVETSPGVHWLCDDEKLRAGLEKRVDLYLSHMTDGMLPVVRVERTR